MKRRPKAANRMKRRPKAANRMKRRPKAANRMKRRPEAANRMKRRLEAANRMKRRPEAANRMRRRPEAANRISQVFFVAALLTLSPDASPPSMMVQRDDVTEQTGGGTSGTKPRLYGHALNGEDAAERVEPRRGKT
ncbi:hypothetical protein EYF80_062109 [Liparis tanakae]|uniref:Uncharacterized protein n=1 Tax=Liparis tanakae TaxID=230148 RepID=A0A4Z2EGY4_9TELE|nr:hypothetical protein EYF80_062109 [Liparis tanakae]